jgi:hypothetical protein
MAEVGCDDSLKPHEALKAARLSLMNARGHVAKMSGQIGYGGDAQHLSSPAERLWRLAPVC